MIINRTNTRAGYLRFLGGNYPDGECNCTAPTSATTPGGAMSVAYVAVYEKHGAPAKTTTTAASPGSGAPQASFWGNIAVGW